MMRARGGRKTSKTNANSYPKDFGCPEGGNGGTKKRREKRWPQCNFLKQKFDPRIYRDGEHMCLSYSGHVPGGQFIYGRNRPTCTTFAKRRLCRYTPYEFVDPDGCCSPNGIFL